MALSTPHSRPLGPARIPKRLAVIGLAAVVGVGGTYVAVAGNPLAHNSQTVVYDTAPVQQGTLRVSVAASGPITNPQSVPLSFKSSGKLSEVDVAVGQQVTAGQVLAKLETTDLQAGSCPVKGGDSAGGFQRRLIARLPRRESELAADRISVGG